MNGFVGQQELIISVRAFLGIVVFSSLWLVLPAEDAVDVSEKMDWFGSALGIGGLILFNFVWK